MGVDTLRAEKPRLFPRFTEVEMPQPEWSGLRLHFLSRRDVCVKPGAGATILWHVLTAIRRIDNFVLGKEFIGEDRDLDRILRRLKLHAESRQFGG